MITHRSILLVLAGFACASSALVQTCAASSSPDLEMAVVKGHYRGLVTGTAGEGIVTGTSGPGVIAGVLGVDVQSTGLFTAGLTLGGVRYPFAGKFTEGTFSGAVGSGTASQIGIALSFTGTDSLTGTVTDGEVAYHYSGGREFNKSAAGGRYRFIMSPTESLESGTAPGGTGYGSVHVRTDGAVSIVGRLPNGNSFVTASAVTSGSMVVIYTPRGDSPDAGVAGTLVFQDVPNVSDCAGVLYFSEPPSSNPQYLDGYALATEFVAAQTDRVIGGLNRDVATFTATGGDLDKTVSSDITLTLAGRIDHGAANGVHLTVSRFRDTFFGLFIDPTTQVPTAFGGVILPKSRTGAGLFLSEGVSGTVTIQY